MKHILMIIAPQGYQDIEYGTPKERFERAEMRVTTAAQQIGECHGKLGGIAQATIALVDVNVSDYDATVFIGGPGASVYQQNSEAHRIARETLEKQRLLCAICIAPAILAVAGVLKDKQATVWNKDEQQGVLLEQHGARYQREHVVIDGNIITADGPAAAGAFADTIIARLSAKVG